MSGTKKNLRLFGGFFTALPPLAVMENLQKVTVTVMCHKNWGDSLGLKGTTNLGDFLRRFRFLDLMVRSRLFYRLRRLFKDGDFEKKQCFPINGNDDFDYDYDYDIVLILIVINSDRDSVSCEFDGCDHQHYHPFCYM